MSPRDGTDVGHDYTDPPDHDAVTGARGRVPGRQRRRRRGERALVPDAKFESYYGRPILNGPTWSPLDIAGYLFLGGLAGGSSVLAAGADLTGRRGLAIPAKIGALLAILTSLVALVHDLGRPARFANMLRVFKPSSPMSVGSWVLTAYGPQAGIAAACAVTGLFPRTGRVATVGAGLLGPVVASYTAALIADTAVPAWHEAHREMPFVFVGSAAAAAGGLGMVAAPLREAGPARRAVIIGSVAELTAIEIMQRSMGLSAEALHSGTAGRLHRAARALTLAGAVTATAAGHRSRKAAVFAGAAALAGSACTRFAIFHAGVASAHDPKYTVVPQRERLSRQAQSVPS
ncbi:NrfD/PsrC family molybdoenzyme membrane anchor subunit [Mycolicibacterium aichiense]|uniref:NrfD/PsrC family molybdoenzyme membrane anchor subunit n=1 Tax=Mycolicibacterium aichiense TaxID=1799 RepID=UPI003D66C428